MPEEVFEAPQPTQTTESKPTNWPKMILVAVLGLALLAASAYAGYWYGTESMLNVTPECNLPTSDAGKECTDSSQCESYCQAEEGAKRGDQASGRCYEWQSVYTCMQEVRGGVVDVTWCY